jgi:hypothetical protein
MNLIPISNASIDARAFLISQGAIPNHLAEGRTRPGINGLEYSRENAKEPNPLDMIVRNTSLLLIHLQLPDVPRLQQDSLAILHSADEVV